MIRSSVKESAYHPSNNLAIPPIWRSENEPRDGYLYLHAPRHMARHDPQLAEAVHIISNTSDLGWNMLSQAKRRRVGFQRKELEGDIVGLYCNNRVFFNNLTSLDEDLCILPHELMHWMQPQYRSQQRWGFQSRLIANLSMEAGAESCAVKVAHQIREKGYSGAFDNVTYNPKCMNYSGIYYAFDKGLKEAIDHKFLAPQLHGTDAAFYSYFHQPALVKYYGQTVLEIYIQDIIRGKCSNPVNGLSARDVFNLAVVGYKEQLIYSPVDLPRIAQNIFHSNPSLKEAFEYAEAVQILNYCNKNTSHPQFRKKQDELMDAGNPYMGIDLRATLRDLKLSKNMGRAQNIINIMKMQAGLSPEY